MTKRELFFHRVRKLFHSFCLIICGNGYKRANWIKNHNLFCEFGEHCYWHPRSIPQDSKFIKIKDNVYIAANVSFIGHDMSDSLLNNLFGGVQVLSRLHHNRQQCPYR